MPIPTPRPEETHDEYTNRCMSDDLMQKEYDQEQRYAICQSKWESKNEDITTKIIDYLRSKCK